MSRSAYELTKLAFSDVVTYRRVVADLRANRKFRRMSYEHSRNVIQEYHNSEGDLGVLESAISELEDLMADEENPNNFIEPSNNKVILESYRESFAEPFRKAAGDLPPEFASFEMQVGVLRVTGKPHIQVVNSRGKIKYLYILTSKEWTEDQKGFFISLLGEIVATNVEGVSPRDVEGIDCRTGNKIIRNGLGHLFQNRLNFLAEDLARLELL